MLNTSSFPEAEYLVVLKNFRRKKKKKYINPSTARREKIARRGLEEKGELRESKESSYEETEVSPLSELPPGKERTWEEVGFC